MVQFLEYNHCRNFVQHHMLYCNAPFPQQNNQVCNSGWCLKLPQPRIIERFTNEQFIYIQTFLANLHKHHKYIFKHRWKKSKYTEAKTDVYCIAWLFSRNCESSEIKINLDWFLSMHQNGRDRLLSNKPSIFCTVLIKSLCTSFR